MIEKWKIIECATNYSVSNLGRVKNNKTQRIYKNDITFEELVDEVFYDISFKRPRGTINETIN